MIVGFSLILEGKTTVGDMVEVLQPKLMYLIGNSKLVGSKNQGSDSIEKKLHQKWHPKWHPNAFSKRTHVWNGI